MEGKRADADFYRMIMDGCNGDASLVVAVCIVDVKAGTGNMCVSWIDVCRSLCVNRCWGDDGGIVGDGDVNAGYCSLWVGV